jgi:hypothetical protein
MFMEPSLRLPQDTQKLDGGFVYTQQNVFDGAKFPREVSGSTFWALSYSLMVT